MCERQHGFSDLRKRGFAVSCTLLMALGAMTVISSSFATNAAAGAPYWKVVKVPVDRVMSQKPYGILTCKCSILKLMNDGNNQYDWYAYELRVETLPGCAKWAGIGSPWQTHHAGMNFVVYDTTAGRDLYDKDPTDSIGWDSGTAQASVNIGLNLGVSAGISYSFSIAWVNVQDKSSMPDDKAGWRVDFNTIHSPSKNSYWFKPAFIEMTNDDKKSVCEGNLHVTWCNPNTGNTIEFDQVSFYWDVLYKGDT